MSLRTAVGVARDLLLTVAKRLDFNPGGGKKLLTALAAPSSSQRALVGLSEHWPLLARLAELLHGDPNALCHLWDVCRELEASKSWHEWAAIEQVRWKQHWAELPQGRCVKMDVPAPPRPRDAVRKKLLMHGFQLIYLPHVTLGTIDPTKLQLNRSWEESDHTQGVGLTHYPGQWLGILPQTGQSHRHRDLLDVLGVNSFFGTWDRFVPHVLRKLAVQLGVSEEAVRLPTVAEYMLLIVATNRSLPTLEPPKSLCCDRTSDDRLIIETSFNGISFKAQQQSANDHLGNIFPVIAFNAL